jgi:hypothetical protein
MAVLDPSTPGGVRLSAATELHILQGSNSAPGPISDDSSVTVSLGVPPLCGPGSIPFFGVSYAQMHVISNGRVQFTGATGNTTFTPTVAQALTDLPFVGAWCDLNPGAGGTITITTPAPDQVQVNYNAVPYFATSIPNTFSINFNATTGAITLQNLTGLGVGTANLFLGISQGNTGATDPGVTPFNASGIPTTTGNGTTDMIYNFGIQGPGLAGGATNITFSPSGAGYTWTGS